MIPFLQSYDIFGSFFFGPLQGKEKAYVDTSCQVISLHKLVHFRRRRRRRRSCCCIMIKSINVFFDCNRPISLTVLLLYCTVIHCLFTVKPVRMGVDHGERGASSPRIWSRGRQCKLPATLRFCHIGTKRSVLLPSKYAKINFRPGLCNGSRWGAHDAPQTH